MIEMIRPIGMDNCKDCEEEITSIEEYLDESHSISRCFREMGYKEGVVKEDNWDFSFGRSLFRRIPIFRRYISLVLCKGNLFFERIDGRIDKTEVRCNGN